MPKRPVVATSIGAVALALMAGACGSSATTSSAGSAATTTTSAPATTAGTVASGGTPDATFTTGAAPTVTGATDLAKEPKVAPGAGAPPTKLTGQDLVVGTGAAAVDTSMVKVQYVGAFYNTGKVFDASWTDSGPATFPLSGVIPGFKDAIIGMKIGGRREVVIPPALGYGAAGQPPTIPPNSTLVFIIDLLAVT